jgi:CRP-like cAMP-binding protein
MRADTKLRTSPDIAHIIQGIKAQMAKQISITRLSKFEPLNSLNPENVKEIAAKLGVIEIHKGDNVFMQGDSNDDHLFLYEGEVELREGNRSIKTIEAGSNEARVALAHIIPRDYSAVAKSDVTVISVNSDLLDLMLTWDQTGSFQVVDLDLQTNNDDWMSRILQTEAFHRIPPANIQAIFTSLQDINYRAGDAVIRQDEPGDYFYIIKSGRCMVTRKMPGQTNEIKLAELRAGDSFGEEALISDATRNATIVMLTSGTLSRLSKEKFLELLNEPMLEKIDYSSAKAKVASGDADWLDVRLPAEHESVHICGDLNIPLIFLRMKAATLNQGKHYVVYCDTGRRSSSASYLLNERGFNTSVLINGLKDIPKEDMEGTAVA